MSSRKGQYRRLVGNHTHSFCGRALKRSVNEIQKKILFIASAGADDFMAKKLDIQVDKKVFFARKKNLMARGISPKNSGLALRVYLSTLMILLGREKDLLLDKLRLNETEWLTAWCWVFEYGFEDKEIFNSELITNYQQAGVVGLVQAASRIINTSLRLEQNEIDGEVEVLREALIHDATVIHGVIV